MSNQPPVPTTADNRVYRGRTIEELLPKIREELGADAMVVAQREGLAGGVAGFFQHPFVEIEARRAGFSAYDTDGEEERETPQPAEEPDPVFEPWAHAAEGGGSATATDLAFAEQLNAAAIGDDVQRLVTRFAEDPAPSPEPEPATREKRAEQYIARLVDAGLPAALAADVVDETLSHSAPFGPPRQLKRLVRATLARRIPVEPGFRGRRRTIAIVGTPGSGKSLVADRLAAAYETGSDLPVRRVELGRGDVWPRNAEGFAVVDTPGVSRTKGEAIAALAAQLQALELDEVHLALPATLSRPAAAELLDALAPLKATRLVLTHADETEHVAPVVGLAIERGIPFSFLSFGDALPVGIVPADAHDLAGRVLG